MSRASRARRIVTAAAYGGGSIGLLGAALWGVLFSEAKLARRWVGTPGWEAPAGDGIWGTGDSAMVTLAVLGDSSAAGLGARETVETPGVLLASGLSAVSERPVKLVNMAVVGAKSRDLADQLDRVEPFHPDVALIMIGANDVTNRIRPAESVRHLAEAVARLRAIDCQVGVGPCPDLGTIKPIV
ncbi:MAG TPA: GDSL-type esterase/lipase family protein, partial [Mycobacteriales bacterium]